jgi:hypothetical protein
MTLTALSPLQELRSWTPTWTNVTMGASVSTGWYVRIGGRWIVFDAELVLGAGFAFTSNPRCNLPVLAAAAPPTTQFHGRAIKSGGAQHPLFFDQNADTSTAPYPLASVTSSTFATWAYLTSSLPFSWAANDRLLVHGRYLAAGAV